MNPDGTNPQKLLSFSGVQGLNPQYSPDGNTIVYEGGPALDYQLGIFTRDVVVAPTKLTDMTAATPELGSIFHVIADMSTRRAEAFENLKSLATAQSAYYGSYGTFSRDFAQLGWQPLAGFRYSYYICFGGSVIYSPEALTYPQGFPWFSSCLMDTDANNFMALASADVDYDDTFDEIGAMYTVGDPAPQYLILQNDMNL